MYLLLSRVHNKRRERVLTSYFIGLAKHSHLRCWILWLETWKHTYYFKLPSRITVYWCKLNKWLNGSWCLLRYMPVHQWTNFVESTGSKIEQSKKLSLLLTSIFKPGRRPAHAWFLEITCMRTSVCVCMCVLCVVCVCACAWCTPPRPWITSGVILTFCDWLNKF